jgi:hypothetical protein
MSLFENEDIQNKNFTISYEEEKGIQEKSSYVVQKGKGFIEYIVRDIKEGIVTALNQNTDQLENYSVEEFKKLVDYVETKGFSIQNEYGLAEVHNSGTFTKQGQEIYYLEINLFNEEDQGKGYGKEIYNEVINILNKTNSLLSPGNVVEGNKVWESFKRDNQIAEVELTNGEKVIVAIPKLENPIDEMISNNLSTFDTSIKNLGITKKEWDNLSMEEQDRIKECN